MRKDFNWKHRWINPAWLYAAFCPGWYDRRAVENKFANDN